MDGERVGVQFACFVQLFQDADDAACAVHVFHVVIVVVGRGFAQAGHDAAQAVNIRHFEIYACFLGYGEQVQNGIGAAAHGDVHGHGVFKGLLGGDAAWQHGIVVLFVMAFGDVYNQPPCF